MTFINKKQRARCNIYEKQKNPKCWNIYAKSHTFFKNQDNLCYVLFTKGPTLYIMRFFINVLKFSFIYIQTSWHFGSHEVLYTKRPILRKPRQLALQFYIFKEPDTLHYAIFPGVLETVLGRGHFLITK